MAHEPEYDEPLSPYPPAAPEPPQVPNFGAGSGPPRDQDLNGLMVNRGGSRRRKPVGGSGSSSQMPPIAPEAPTSHGPPISYRDPYSNGHLGTKTFADRAKDLADEGTPLPSGNTPEPSPVPHEQDQPRKSRHSRNISQYGPSQMAGSHEAARMPFAEDGARDSYESNMKSGNGGRAERSSHSHRHSGGGSTTAPPVRSGTVRDNANPQKVDWAVDHSPLQRLENDLLTKEKKRAKVQQAEQRAKEKEMARKRESQAISASRGGLEESSRSLNPVTASTSMNRRTDPFVHSTQSPASRRVVSDSSAIAAKAAEARVSRIPRPVDIMARHVPGQSVTRTTSHRQRASLDSTVPPISKRGLQPTASTSRRRSLDDRGVRFPQDPVETTASASRPGPNEPPRNLPSQQQEPNVGTGTRQSAMIPSSNPAPQPGQTDQVAGQTRGHHFLPHFRHSQQPGPVNPVLQPGSFLGEWKQGATARLLLSDMTAQPEPQDDTKNVAWWESPSSGRKRGNSVQQQQQLDPETEYFDGASGDPNRKLQNPNTDPRVHFQDALRRSEEDVVYDSSGKFDETQMPKDLRAQGQVVSLRYLYLQQLAIWGICSRSQSYDHSLVPSFPTYIRVPYLSRSLTYNVNSTEPTKFDPPLYMKCGPLLRYTGLKRETNGNVNDGEIWRGSIMIVTIDQASDYSSAPILRLFHQHMDLLPPPPAQISEGEEPLPSEYVDPVAGLPKIARDGSTIYVKPAEDFDEGHDYSKDETDDGLYERVRTANVPTAYGRPDDGAGSSPIDRQHGPVNRRAKTTGRYREVKGTRLHAEQGVTFWRFNIEVELGEKQARIAYRINKGASVGFWVPGRGHTMNMMFHSCNGFSSGVSPDEFSGPDPLWRDVLNAHQTKPFHVMIGGGDQLYNDKIAAETQIFRNWLTMKNPVQKKSAEFTQGLREELEAFYLNSYAAWFSQGLFGMANSQIPMVNIWDDHDIIDGYGSYPHGFMSSPVFSGLGNVAFKYYMLFQHQSVPDEMEADEPSWILGAEPGPYIKARSRSLFISLGKHVSFLGLDCRTERMREEVMSEQTYDRVFDRCRREIVNGETKHLMVLLGVPIAYPRLVWLENILTSRAMDPVKALGRLGMLGNLMNKFDGGYEILDDLDDHWTAAHHKDERRWLIEELQDLAAEKSVRITILGGDVHLGAVGQFYSNKKLRIPKDQDHRYMPNIISSAIVNTPPPDMIADLLNRRDKIHHLDHETDEDMIPMFLHDVDGKKRNNRKLLPRRNWCSICEYHPGSTPPPTPPMTPTPPETPLSQFSDGPEPRRSLSLSRDIRPGNLLRRLSLSNRQPRSPEPESPGLVGDDPAKESYFPPASGNARAFNKLQRNTSAPPIPTRPLGHFHRRPTNLSEKAAKKGGPDIGGEISLENGLDIRLNCEIKQGDPLGSTEPYRLLVPTLWYTGGSVVPHKPRRMSVIQRINSLRAVPILKQNNRDSNASFASRDEPVGPGVARGAARVPATFPGRPGLPTGNSVSVESLPNRPRRQSLLQRFGSLRDKIPPLGRPRYDDEYSQTTNDEYSPHDDAAMMGQSRQPTVGHAPASADNVYQGGRRPSFAQRIGSIGRRLSQMGRPKQYYYSDDEYTATETESEPEHEEDYMGSGDLTRPGRQPMVSPTMSKPAVPHQKQQPVATKTRTAPKDEEVLDPFKSRPKVAMSPPPQTQYAQTAQAPQPQYASAHTGSTDAMVGTRSASMPQSRTGRALPQDNRRSGGVFAERREEISDEDDEMDSIDELDPLKQVPHKRKNMGKMFGEDVPPPNAGAPQTSRKNMSKLLGEDPAIESERRRSMSEKRSSRGWDGIEAYNGGGKKKWWQMKT